VTTRSDSTIEITADTPINAIVKARPETLAVFNKFGIDSCCGGALPLAEVARRHRIEFIALLAELDRA
jgi:iron-sulfur cluster repair protein YtfE (RIC family)